jgi:peptide/nickel transport system ATP-binding protein/oligopeptide transport system ATP-binding protein
MSILETKNVKTFFPITGGVFSKVTGYVKAVNDVSIYIQEGEIVSVVGESGCGKSTLGLSILGLIPITEGEVYLKGIKINCNKPQSWKTYRKDFQIIFQDPFTSLNPRHTIYRILSEPLLIHGIYSKRDVKEKVNTLMEQVGLTPDYLNRFPHAFSGGQRQRIAIARAIGMRPKLIICDEVVSALDVSVQAQIIQLLLKLKQEMNLSLLFIAHDLSLVKAISDRVYVMYLGKIVEAASVRDVFKKPYHPYTQSLLGSIPTLDRKNKPKILPGEIPSQINPPSGCTFHTRCPIAKKECKTFEPELEEISEGRLVRCPYVNEQ